jgi:hypothetical protein
MDDWNLDENQLVSDSIRNTRDLQSSKNFTRNDK